MKVDSVTQERNKCLIMIEKGIKYAYNDISIVPSTELTTINSRRDCITRNVYGYLPIFTAPMTSVVNMDNCITFINEGIQPVIPRSVDFETRKNALKDNFWVAMSLAEFNQMFVDYSEYHFENVLKDSHFNVCIDVANGHMKEIYDQCIIAKNSSFGKYVLNIMTGNIGNPDTYERICNLKTNMGTCPIDYIRCGIGSGSGCITSSNTSIHYPMASLIDEIRDVREHWEVVNWESNYIPPKIIADGGIRNYSDVIKALALGADYVMIGGLFASCVESAADKYFKNNDGSLTECSQEEAIEKFNNGEEVFSEFYGMASAMGQMSMFGEKKRTSEGITKLLPVKFSIEKWSENMDDYLKSAMSYVGVKKIEFLCDSTRKIIMSNNAKLAINE